MCSTCLSLSALFHLTQYPLGPSLSLQMERFLMYYFLIHLATLCFLIGTFNLFVFKLYVARYTVIDFIIYIFLFFLLKKLNILKYKNLFWTQVKFRDWAVFIILVLTSAEAQRSSLSEEKMEENMEDCTEYFGNSHIIFCVSLTTAGHMPT